MRRIVVSSLLGWSVALLGLMAPQSAANQLSLSNMTFRATWSRLELSAAESTVTCQLTLEGSFHSRTLTKVVGALIGYVTRASLGPCSQGRATILTETLPWHRRYRSFTGTLPNITGVTTTLVRFSIRATSSFGATCIFRSTDAAPFLATANVSAGTITGLSLGGSVPSGSECFSVTGSLAGSSTSATILNSTTRVTVTLITAPPPPPPTPLVVSVGDSFISGEAGRWAGNKAASEPVATRAIDAGGPTAYFDAGTAEQWDAEQTTAERIPLCHRSKAEEVRFGVAARSPLAEYLACSGATTTTPPGVNPFKPGLDFVEIDATHRSQPLMLQELAERNPGAIKMVVISIGGNNFGFSTIIVNCVAHFQERERVPCSTDPVATNPIEPGRITTRTSEIAEAIRNVRTAMDRARYDPTRYKLLVQDYPSILPSSAEARPTDERAGRGCPILDADLDWANRELIPKINGAVDAAVNEVIAGGVANVERLRLQSMLVKHRLCERTVGRLEDAQPPLESWRAAGAVDRSEWVQRFLVFNLGSFFSQESFHPNYWGQMALRSCLRQAYNNGAPKSGTCVNVGPGENGRGEPLMRLN